MLYHTDIFVRKLLKAPNYNNAADGWSPPCNMTACSRHLQYDVMGEFGFGQSFELQTKPDNHFLIDAVTATTHKAGAYVQYPQLQYLQLDRLLYRRGIWMREKYLQLRGRPLGERLSAEKNSQNDLFSFFVDTKDPETSKGFTESKLWAESRFLLITGKHTSYSYHIHG